MAGIENRPRHNSLFQVKHLIIVGTLLTLPTWASAIEFTDFAKDTNALTQIRNAYAQIQEESDIKAVLSTPEINILTVSQRVAGPSQIETTKFQHYYKGIEVIGSMAFHHFGSHGTAIRNQVARFDLEATPSINVETAISLAKNVAGDFPLKGTPELKILPSPSQRTARLVYWIELQGRGWEGEKDIIIDAHSGKIIAHLSHDYSLSPVQIYSAKGQGIKVSPQLERDRLTRKPNLKSCVLQDIQANTSTQLEPGPCMEIYRGSSPLSHGQCQIVDGLSGFPIEINSQSCRQVVTDSTIQDSADIAVRRAAGNSTQVLNYYKSRFDRDSYDGRGAPLVSIIHAGEKMANAFWNSDLNIMVYGDGDGKTMSDLTQALDVAGHEMTHGITTKTAKLLSMNESGALNEAFSDYFGKLIENKNDWVIGRSLFIGPNAPKGIRDLAEPSSINDAILVNGEKVEKPYPTVRGDAASIATDETCDSSNDRCWVHYNSTIPSHAAYLVHQAIGGKKAELLYYTVLTQNLSASDDFRSATQAILNTCTQLNMRSSDCDTVKEIYSESGLL